MGLIGDRKSKKQKEKEKEIEKLKISQNKSKSPLKKGLVAPVGGMMRYPAGYYTTPAPHSSWAHHAHPGQPKQQANLNPRYQTWVAPRKQPHLNQLVSFIQYILYFFFNPPSIQDVNERYKHLIKY